MSTTFRPYINSLTSDQFDKIESDMIRFVAFLIDRGIGQPGAAHNAFMALPAAWQIITEEHVSQFEHEYGETTVRLLWEMSKNR